MKHTFERYCKDYKNIENYEMAAADNFKGWDCHHRLETRKKMGASKKGMHWFNNGKESKFCFECPPGFTPGRLRINKSLQEYLDRTGRHVSRKTFEKYKDKKKIFVAWEILFNIYETHR